MSPISSGSNGNNSGRHLGWSKFHEPYGNAEGSLVKSKRPTLTPRTIVPFEYPECYIVFSQDLRKS